MYVARVLAITAVPLFAAATITGCLSTPPAVAIDAQDRCVFGFEGGELTGTQVFGTGNLGLATSAAQGTFTSPIIASTADRTWDTLAWTTVRPSLKALPDNRTLETAYREGNAVMANNQLLLHVDDSPAFEDSSGNNLSATCAAAPFDQCPATVPGLFRDAVDFDVDADGGSDNDNDRVRIAASPALEGSRMTVETWVRPSRTPTVGSRMMIITKGWQSPSVPPFASYSIEYNANGTFRCYADVDTGGEELVDGDIVVAPGAWHHVACTYDGLALRLFVNGEPDGDFPAVGTLLYNRTGSDDIMMGMYNGSQFLDGQVDEVAVFDQALSPAVVREHARRGALRLTWRIRTCDDPACSGEDNAWFGPTGTPVSYYSEACATGLGLPELDVNDLDCDGDGIPDDGPGLAVPPTRYVQLRAQLDSHRTGDSPELISYRFCAVE